MVLSVTFVSLVIYKDFPYTLSNLMFTISLSTKHKGFYPHFLEEKNSMRADLLIRAH